jgi:hypothetical protein
MRLRLLIAGLILLNAGPSYAAKVLVSIHENTQEMTVSVDGRQEYVWPVSTGLSRYATPAGTYQPFRMEKDHFSVEWDDAPMPHSIFFTPLGHAIHGTEHVDHLGRPASHGCVRLSQENAATLYALVQEAGLPNTTVIVNGSASADKPVNVKPPKRLAKKPPKQRVKEPEQVVVEENPRQLVEESPQQLVEESRQRMVEEPEQLMVEEPEQLIEEPGSQLVENPQSRRLRRTDDPFIDSYN